MSKDYNVLSLFDGMSNGQIALDKLGYKVVNYFASEVDEYAMKVAMKNYPSTIQIGDVRDVSGLFLGKIDLLIGGSPCQGFSFAGKQKGSATKCGIEVTTLEQYLKLKAEKFEFDGQSYLFWEYVRILKEVRLVNPKVKFLLENVRITKKWQKMFDNAMGVEPIVINSALVSAQNRVRYYWTNIDGVKQPKDKGVILRDVLDCGSNVVHQRGRGNNPGGERENKSPCMSSHSWQENVKVGAIRGRYVVDGKRQDHKMKTAGLTTQRLEVRKDEKSNCLTTVQKDNVVVLDKLYNVNPSGNGMNGNVYGFDPKSPTLTTNKGEGTKISPERNMSYRKLTPIECERLQTVPDNYTDCVSNSQRYKMLGNGWTVEVIAHILSNLKK